MKIAVLLQCHKCPEQINLILNVMRHPAFDFYVHVDKKSDIISAITKRDDIMILNDRIDVQWGHVSQVDSELRLFGSALKNKEYDFFWLCSGQDFPIKPLETIVSWFERHPNNDFVDLVSSRNFGAGIQNNFDKRNEIYFPDWLLGKENVRRIAKRAYTELTGGYARTFKWAKRKPVNGLKFYFGSAWVCLSGRTLRWMWEYLDNHPEYYHYFRNCNCPDESFFQTLLMNSPYAGNRMDYLHYVDWSEGKNNPKILTSEDLPEMLQSDKLMARKFDITVDESVLKELSHYVTEGTL